ncbi:MAG: biotin carboxylase N-terminal domain-containing protein [Anaerotardibacter sp.]
MQWHSRIVMVAQMTGCDAIHPGYGFLAESASFARMCEAEGTSTHMNDTIESKAFHQVFGQETPYVSSTKSMTGHLLGAAGAVETIFTAAALKDGFIPPNINHQVADPECNINLVANQGISADIHYALYDSLGFDGIKKCRFKNKVAPGDVLDMQCEIIEMRGPMGIGKAVASVNNKVACQAELTFAVG